MAQGEVADGRLEGRRVAEKIQKRCHHVQRIVDHGGEAPALGVLAAPGAQGSLIEEFVKG